MSMGSEDIAEEIMTYLGKASPFDFETTSFEQG